MWCAIVCLLLSCLAQLCLSGYHGSSSHSSSNNNNNQYYSGYDSGPYLPSIPGFGMALGPNELQNLLSNFGMSAFDRNPVVTEHIYGSPQKLIISDYQGPMKQLYGTVRSFHQVRTIDAGGHNFGYSSNSYDQNSASNGYEDFMFPPDW